MQTKLLSSIISSIAGKPAVDIMNLLFGKKNVNEFVIAKKLKMTINQIRNVLYKLSDANLVSFTRKKDKRKGWYTYFWTLNLEKALDLIKDNINKEINNLRAQLKSRKEKRFYTCKTCLVEVSEETALLHDFVCNECGQVYELNADKKILLELENKIQRLERELVLIEEELGKIGVEKVKKIEKETRKEKAEKIEKRLLKKKQREREKRKLNKPKKKKEIKKIKRKKKR